MFDWRSVYYRFERPFKFNGRMAGIGQNPMPRRTTRSEERRIEILKSAAAAFRRRGYHGAGVEEIARALGMTKGSLYYYFKDKQDLLYQCHLACMNVSLQALAQAKASRRPPAARLRAVLTQHIRAITDEVYGAVMLNLGQ